MVDSILCCPHFTVVRKDAANKYVDNSDLVCLSIFLLVKIRFDSFLKASVAPFLNCNLHGYVLDMSVPPGLVISNSATCRFVWTISTRATSLGRFCNAIVCGMMIS